MVYVISKSGKPLDPTRRCGKVRRLLKEGKAKVVHREPFTIQLLSETTEFTRDFTMGVDPGYKTIGIRVSDQNEEVYASETEIRTGIPKRLSERRELRRAQTDYEMYGFRLNDKVLFNDQVCFVANRRKSGYFKLKSLDGSFNQDNISYIKCLLF